nr:Class II aldolase/adducin family protein [uncultured bacterium]
MNNIISNVKTNIISIGRLLWDKDLVGGFNGNISARVNDDSLLMTGRGTCLGLLNENEIVLMHNNGKVIDGPEPSSERMLHLDIYRHFPKVRAIVHTHTTFTNAFFLRQDIFEPSTLEAAHTIGQVRSVEQKTINVEDSSPVINLLKSGSIVALKRHGVVSVGINLFECFVRIQGLEEQIKLQAVSKMF